MDIKLQEINLNVVQALKERNFEAEVLESKEAVLNRIKELVPKGVSVMNGSSKTLEEIGFVEYLKLGKHGWVNLHEKALAEKDPAKQALLRKETTVSDFYLGSVHALTEKGELLIVSNTGSQLPGIAFNAQNLIFVVGMQKIVSDLSEAFKRVRDVVMPLEDQRLQKAYGVSTSWSKSLILHKENPMLGRKVKVLIVKEKLGF
jgi:L-lactate utilization protein LutC